MTVTLTARVLLRRPPAERHRGAPPQLRPGSGVAGSDGGGGADAGLRSLAGCSAPVASLFRLTMDARAAAAGNVTPEPRPARPRLDWSWLAGSGGSAASTDGTSRRRRRPRYPREDRLLSRGAIGLSLRYLAAYESSAEAGGRTRSAQDRHPEGKEAERVVQKVHHQMSDKNIAQPAVIAAPIARM